MRSRHAPPDCARCSREVRRDARCHDDATGVDAEGVEASVSATLRRAPLGALILDARVAAGLSLRDFADLCGASPSHVSLVERGGTPSEALLTRMCNVLRVPVSERDHWYAAAGVLPAEMLRALLERPERWAAVREVMR